MNHRIVWGLPLAFLVVHYGSPWPAGIVIGTVGFWSSLAVVIVSAIARDAKESAADRKAFESRALRGEAQILQLHPSSTDGLVQLVVRVTPVITDEEHGYRESVGQTFTTEGSVAVNAIYLPRVQPGCTVPLIYDPQNRARFELGDLSR